MSIRCITDVLDTSQHKGSTVLDLLPDRTSATLADWLARHPTVRRIDFACQAFEQIMHRSVAQVHNRLWAAGFFV
jgi:hypothetical protein